MELPPSFELAKEVTIQLLTLATAVIGVSVTFAKDISPTVSKTARGLLYSSWICFLLSVIGGIWTLAAMTGTLAKGPEIKPDAVYDSNITLAAGVQVMLFLAGVVVLVLHAMRRFR